MKITDEFGGLPADAIAARDVSAATVAVVIITRNRRVELMRTLTHMLQLPDQPRLIVVDNASDDGTADAVRGSFSQVELIVLAHNLGAAARNIGVEAAGTPYVAFCDDDSWWAPGTLSMATTQLDQYPRLAAVCGRILLGEQQREDPVCREMAESPLPREGMPGPVLLGFIACAVVFRVAAYREAGGYEQRFFVGGEEELLSLDLVRGGWKILYDDRLTVHHYPSPQRDNRARQRIVLRNQLWVAWLRYPLPHALQRSWRICRAAPHASVALRGLVEALGGVSWVWRRRDVLPEETLRLVRRLEKKP